MDERQAASMAAPVVGGAIGLGLGLTFASVGGPLGFAVGWLVGSWLGGMLAEDKNEIVDTGAQEAPRFNTAVRGATVPVLFGTNRVASQIVWQANFVAERIEADSGGGKLGGSGNGFKGSAATTGDSYSYSIDAVYHLGLVPEPYSLFGGWMGGKRLNSEAITAIQSQASGSDGFIEFQSFANITDQVGMEFTSAVYFPGEQPTSTDWSYLTSQVGMGVTWPGTAWVGFRTLSLGASAAMPQLTFEIGPGAADLTVDSNFIAAGQISTAWNTAGENIARNDGEGVDIYGNIWVTSYDSGDATVGVWSRTGVRVNQTTGAALFAAMRSATGIYDPGGTFSIDNFMIGAFVEGTKIVAMWRSDTSNLAVPATVYYWACGDPQADGTVSWTGASWSNTLNPGDGTQYGSESGGLLHMGSKLEDDRFLFWGNATYFILLVPSISEMETIYLAQKVANHRFRFANFATMGTYFGLRGNSSDFDPLMFSLGDRIYWYINGVNVNAAGWIAANVADEGNLIYFDLPAIALSYSLFYDILLTPTQNTFSHDMSDPVVFTNCFVETDGITTYSNFDDEIINYDGSIPATYAWTYQPRPYIKLMDTGGYLVIWTLKFDGGNTDPTEWTVKTRLRVYIYSPLTGLFYEYVKVKGFLGTYSEISGNTYTNQTLVNWTTTQVEWTDDNRLIFYMLLKDNRIAVSEFGELSLDGGGDVYPPYIIAQILTNELFGLYPGADIIDADSYATALAYCQTNLIKVSVQYRREEGALQIIELLLATYGGWLAIDATSGKIKFGYQDLTNTPVRTIDNDHLVIRQEGESPVHTKKGALQDTFNVVRINYTDRDLDYQQNQVEERDEVDEDLNGTRLKEFPNVFVMTRDLASRMANQALWTNLYTRDVHQFVLTWKDADLEPGDMITLVDSFSNLAQVCQITRWVEQERGLFEVSAQQQLGYVPGVSATSVGSVNWAFLASGGTNPSSQGTLSGSGTIIDAPTTVSSPPVFETLGNVPAPRDFQMYELPAEFETGESGRLYVWWQPAGFAQGARLHVSADGVSYAPTITVEPYPLGGSLLTGLLSTDAVELNVQVALFPSSAYTANSPAYEFNATLNDVDAAAMHLGAGLMWVGSEMLAYQDVTLLSQNKYQLGKVFRGWGGTAIGAHSSGDIWVKQGGGIFAREYSTDQIGSLLYYKVTPYNNVGVQYNVASVVAKTYTIQGRFWAPPIAPTPQFRTYRGITQVNVGPAADIDIYWHDSARRSGFGTGGYGSNAGGYGGFATDPLSHGWKVNIYGASGVVVRSTTVGTPAFTYTDAQNIADNGGWRGLLGFQITPYSLYGDAPSSSVLSLNLFF